MKKMALKTTLCILIPLILFLLVGCMKTPEINKDFGPEITPVVINQALTDAKTASTSTTINNILKGEFVYIEKSNQIENLFPMVIQQKGDTVSDRQDQTDKIIYTITRELKEIDVSTGTSKDSKTQETACLEKVAGACGPASAAAAPSTSNTTVSIPSSINIHSLYTNPPPELMKFNERMKDLSLSAIVKQMATDPTQQFTYHNLKTRESTMPTPGLVSLRPNCGGRGQDKCGSPMKTYEVTFDEVDWLSEQYPVKYSYKLVFSPDAPFFSSLMSSCGATTIPYENQRIALLQCENALDFTVGQ
jgi:hypothetical protein